MHPIGVIPDMLQRFKGLKLIRLKVMDQLVDGLHEAHIPQLLALEFLENL